MIEILLSWLLSCISIQDFNEFSACIDNVVIEYNLSLKNTEWTD
jgi:hypothetical protein